MSNPTETPADQPVAEVVTKNRRISLPNKQTLKKVGATAAAVGVGAFLLLKVGEQRGRDGLANDLREEIAKEDDVTVVEN